MFGRVCENLGCGGCIQIGRFCESDAEWYIGLTDPTIFAELAPISR